VSSNSRQSGRTTALVEQAKALADAGRNVFILAANGRHERFLSSLFSGYGKIFVGTESILSFDWNTMEMRFANPTSVVLVDHYSYESKVRELQREVQNKPETIPTRYISWLPDC
jgi:hypothetical protein